LGAVGFGLVDAEGADEDALHLVPPIWSLSAVAQLVRRDRHLELARHGGEQRLAPLGVARREKRMWTSSRPWRLRSTSRRSGGRSRRSDDLPRFLVSDISLAIIA